jgi:SAM-dependent methyltransferase
MKHPDKEWEKFGVKEPYYSIMCDDKFRKESLTEELLNRFFKSGEDFVKYVLERIRNSVDPTFLNPKNALDFGCGVGRCAIPLAKVCEKVIGTDVSESMLQEAKKNSVEQSVTNVDFIKSDDFLTQINGTFDLIVSFEVFHNIPLNRGYKLFENLLDRLSQNGVMAVDILYHREAALAIRFIGKLRKLLPFANSFVNLILRRPIFEPLIEKNVYDINKLFYFLDKKACSNIYIEFFGKDQQLHIFLFTQRKTNETSISNFL